jgi:hypothetical protein
MATAHIEIGNPQTTQEGNTKLKDKAEPSKTKKIEHERHADDKKDKQQQMTDDEMSGIHKQEMPGIHKQTDGEHAKKNDEEKVVTHHIKDGGGGSGSRSHGKKETPANKTIGVVAPVVTAGEAKGKKGKVINNSKNKIQRC